MSDIKGWGEPEGALKVTLLKALLEAIEDEILPLTKEGVHIGNKIFGAALLRKSDFSVVLAATNNELENPLWHGEVHAIKRFYELPEENRPSPKELIFLSTHEPCSMCLSAITWAGFDNFYYFFSHENSRDSFNIPHDLNILKEVFTLDPGKYRHHNAYWDCTFINDAVQSLNVTQRTPLEAQVQRIRSAYDALSKQYQLHKADNSIPLN